MLGSLIFLQLASRLLTFTLNQALIRLTTPKAYGTASIQFELLSSTILFLGREGIRNAVLRSKSAESQALSWLPLLLGSPISLISTTLYVRTSNEDVLSQDWFFQALFTYVFAALLELASEPGHNYAMVTGKTQVRVRAEGLGVTLKTISTFVVLFLFNDYPLMAYAFGQLVYSIILFGIYLGSFGLAPWCTRPTLNIRHTPLFRLSLTMTLQSVIKHFLTEGDKIILSYFAKVEDQAGYAIAVNYGSLIARIIFQPTEETLRVFYSKNLPSPDSLEAPRSSERKAAHGQLKNTLVTLTSLLQLQVAFSVVLVLFGSAYLDTALRILLPSRYLETSAPWILRAYILYIPFLAVNGGLEAFVSSASTPRDLNKQSSYMVAFSALYTVTAIALYTPSLLPFESPGDASLVYANIVNLAARIGYALWFTSRYFSPLSGKQTEKISVWRYILPSLPVLFLSCITHGSLHFDFVPRHISKSGGRFRATMEELVVGGILATLWVGVWWIVEGRMLVRTFRSVLRQQKPHVQ